MRSLKALLLQMKIDSSSEMRILAEEEIINMFEDQKLKNQKLVSVMERIKAQTEYCINIASGPTAPADTVLFVDRTIGQALATYANNESENEGKKK